MKMMTSELLILCLPSSVPNSISNLGSVLVLVSKSPAFPIKSKNIYYDEQVQYKKPKQANLGDLSCGHNNSLRLKSPHGESYNFVFYSLTFLLFGLELILGN